MADKAAATKAAAARKAGKEEVVAAAATAATKDGEEEETEEPASKKQRRAVAEEEEGREVSPEVIVVEVRAAAAADEVDAASRESSPEAPVTPDVSGMEEEGGEEDADAETSTAETTTTERDVVDAEDDDTADDDDGDKELDPARFSHISDRAYSPQDVVDATARLVAALPAQLRTGAPNAKMFLRSFWYRAVAGGALASSSSAPPSESGGGDKMHVYTLASFFLQLSLLDQESSEVAPSAAAAGALSLALEVFSSSPPSRPSSSSPPVPSDARSSCWPACLQRYSGIDAAAVALQRERLRRVQRESGAPHLRAVWASRHEHHGYPEFAAEWELALRTMKEAGEV